ncbi:MAG: hypothetical protein ACRYHC_12895 [Janthinobacterium lividum]
MTTITVDDGGKPKVLSDVAPLVAERADIAARLDRIYAGYEERTPGTLDSQEALIVGLVNRYNQLGDWIELLENTKARHANINSGWTLVKQIRGGRS